MKILFVNPNRMQPPVAPLAVDYLGEALRARDHPCSVADFCLEGPDTEDISPDLLKRSFNGTPDAILVTMRNLDDAYYFSRETFLPQTRNLVQALRKKFEKPVIVGGSGFSIAPEALLALLGTDFGVSGASEQDLLGLVASLDREETISDLAGVVWKEGEIVRANPPSPPVMEEDFYSARGFVRNRLYFRKGGMVGLETKRGCSAPCRFCVDPVVKGTKTFTKSLSVLTKEIRALVDQGAPVFHLCDSEFNLPRNHALSVCKTIQEEGLSGKIRWYTYATPLGFDDELAFQMKEAGCAGINFGVDHCRDEILENLGRTHGRQDLKRTAEACKSAGLSFLFDLLLGGPGETRATLRDVIEMCRGLDVPRVGTNVGIRIYPNTRLAEEMGEQGPMSRNPNLAGCVEQNEDLLLPVFYCSHLLGKGWESYLEGLIDGDPRFFLPIREAPATNYNYNENQILVDALNKGHKGAFWDILYRIQEERPPLQVPE